MRRGRRLTSPGPLQVEEAAVQAQQDAAGSHRTNHCVGGGPVELLGQFKGQGFEAFYKEGVPQVRGVHGPRAVNVFEQSLGSPGARAFHRN